MRPAERDGRQHTHLATAKPLAAAAHADCPTVESVRAHGRTDDERADHAPCQLQHHVTCGSTPRTALAEKMTKIEV